MTRARRAAAPTSPSTGFTVDDWRRKHELEIWVCEQLHVRDLFAGVTTTAVRRDRLKVLLLERGLTNSHAGRRDGQAFTWANVFEHLYGEKLAA